MSSLPAARRRHDLRQLPQPPSRRTAAASTTLHQRVRVPISRALNPGSESRPARRHDLRKKRFPRAWLNTANTRSFASSVAAEWAWFTSPTTA